MTAPSDSVAADERELLAAARGGDEDAFRRLVEAHRDGLSAHCYRMLGSLYDAEDALQETLLRGWRGLPAHQGRSSLRPWLHRIATNVCLDAIARRPKRVLPIDYGPPTVPGEQAETPLHEVCWIEPYPDRELGVTDGRGVARHHGGLRQERPPTRSQGDRRARPRAQPAADAARAR